MKACPEGTFTAGHLWMAALAGFILAVVVVGLIRDQAPRRDPPSEG